MLVWERIWLERSRISTASSTASSSGAIRRCRFGLNVWNRNHFNPIRKAQWSWEEQTDYADWVKPITYQHQAGEVFDKEMGFFASTILRDYDQAGVRAGDVQASWA